MGERNTTYIPVYGKAVHNTNVTPVLFTPKEGPAPQWNLHFKTDQFIFQVEQRQTGHDWTNKQSILGGKQIINLPTITENKRKYLPASQT